MNMSKLTHLKEGSSTFKPVIFIGSNGRKPKEDKTLALVKYLLTSKNPNFFTLFDARHASMSSLRCVEEQILPELIKRFSFRCSKTNITANPVDFRKAIIGYIRRLMYSLIKKKKQEIEEENRIKRRPKNSKSTGMEVPEGYALVTGTMIVSPSQFPKDNTDQFFWKV